MAEHIVFVMSDQHNPQLMGCAGHDVIQTPNMDALAARGTYFPAAYTPSPICVPARASWATGLEVNRIGYWDNAMAYDGRVAGWGHALQAADIRCESIGKLHYRNGEDPTGFDVQHIPMHIAGGVGQVWGSVRDPLPIKEGAEFLCILSGAGESDYTRYDGDTTQRAVDWLADAPADEPWVLYVGLVAPHHPYLAPQEWFDRYPHDQLPAAKLHPEDGHWRHPWADRVGSMTYGADLLVSPEDRKKCTAAYYGLVSYLDDNLGRIMSALDEHGLTDSTTLVYTSDHGDMVGSRGMWGKQQLYQESAGVPLVVAGPGIPEGKVSKTATTLVDGFATVCDVMGVEQTDQEERTSISWRQLASADDDEGRTVLSEYHAMGSPCAGFLVRQGDWKLHWFPWGYPPELFNLAEDPDELHDLARDFAHIDKRKELEGLLRSFCDPEAVDLQAKADKDALVARFGGPVAAMNQGTAAETPTPGGGSSGDWAKDLRSALVEPASD